VWIGKDATFNFQLLITQTQTAKGCGAAMMPLSTFHFQLSTTHYSHSNSNCQGVRDGKDASFNFQLFKVPFGISAIILKV